MQISDINFQPLLDNLGIKFGTVFQVDTSGKRPKLVHLDIMNKCGIFQMHLDGGSNGMKLMTAWVNEHNVWTFNVPNHQV